MTFQCLVSGDQPVTITWTRDGMREGDLASDRRVTVSGTMLTIADIRQSDAGRYVCKAHNSFIAMGGRRTSTATARLNVQSKHMQGHSSSDADSDPK